jgi:CRP-like cAMP-binding protein
MVDQAASNVRRNGILGAISNADLARLQPHLQPTPLKFRQRLQSENRQIRAVYFPESGIASVVAVGGGERRQAEVALIGREGMAGLPVVHGADRSPCDVFIQVEGERQCISSENLRHVMEESPSLLRCFLRYAHVFTVQSGYTALANARVDSEERLARWLLMTPDRVDDDKMVLTHEFIALMLGVRRAGATSALQGFKSKEPSRPMA